VGSPTRRSPRGLRAQRLLTAVALSEFPSGRVAASTRPATPLAAMRAFSCQLPVTPSRVGMGVANLAPSVTSGSQLCVRVGKRGAEKKGWRGPVASGIPTFRIHSRAGFAWLVAKAADAPRGGSRRRLAEFRPRRLTRILAVMTMDQPDEFVRSACA
jgi:hypothetical protein